MAKNSKKISIRSPNNDSNDEDNVLSIAYFDRKMSELKNTLATKEDLAA